MPVDFSGKYVSTDRHENMDKFLELMGKNAIQRGIAKKATITIEITQDGDKVGKVKITTPKGTTENSGVMGEECDITLPTGDTGKALANWDGDRIKAVAKLDNGKEVTVIRWLEDGHLVQSMQIGGSDVVFKRYFKKQ